MNHLPHLSVSPVAIANVITRFLSKRLISHALVCLLVLTAFTSHSFALSVNTHIQAGHDSNPYTLADKFDPKSASFVQLKAALKQKVTKKLKVSVAVNSKQYSSDAKDADSNRAKLALKYRSRIGKDKKSNVTLEADMGAFDKTYVSHSTGKVGVFGNQEIADRYDYQWWSTSATLSKKISRALTFNVGTELLTKDYEDLGLDGLSNFDYQQLTFSSRWRYRFSKSHRSVINLALAKRKFDDKREISITGKTLDNTDLMYTHKNISLSHRYKASKYLTLRGKLSYFDQQDSGEGYYDYDRISAQFAVRYRLFSLSSLQAKIDYRKDDYERDSSKTSSSPDEEERLSERKGSTLSLRFESRLPFKHLLSKRRAKAYPTAFVQWENTNIDANDENYTYDRQRVTAGVFFHF